MVVFDMFWHEHPNLKKMAASAILVTGLTTAVNVIGPKPVEAAENTSVKIVDTLNKESNIAADVTQEEKETICHFIAGEGFGEIKVSKNILGVPVVCSLNEEIKPEQKKDC